MVNPIPAQNLQAAAVGGAIAVIVVHICAANGIIIPSDVGDAITTLATLLTAHFWDMATGGNKPAP